MGCLELQAIHLETQLENGDNRQKAVAAKLLAGVYATMLARADEETDQDLLQRAISLFDRIPSAGTTELRLQLYRATFIASEQILERYRLRISTREEANIAIEQLHKVTEDLQSLQQILLKRVRSLRSSNPKAQEQLGLATSYLAWARYYIAWHENNQLEATASAQLFAEILLGERPSLQSVSLDLKAHEAGARAILGIALCNAVLSDPADPEPWFEELNDQKTWSSVRLLVPLWKFFLLIDDKKWGEVLQELQTLSGANQALMYRVAAVHSLEFGSTKESKEVAKKSIQGLVSLGQLGILSDIIKLYGDSAMEHDGFITKYIEGDIAYRDAKELYPSDLPTTHTGETVLFSSIGSIFQEALQAEDKDEHIELVDDCQFMLGLSLFYSSQFSKAAIAFTSAATGDNKEQSIWMAIVSYNNVETLSPNQSQLKENLSSLYLRNWPNSEHASQLTIHQSNTVEVKPENIDALLAIPHTDPKFEDAQRQAARSLYQLWQSTNNIDKADVGNRYITIALPLMISDVVSPDDKKRLEIAVVRALRILELSLHQEVNRIIATERALEVLDTIKTNNYFPLHTFVNEIAFRRIALHLLKNKPTEAELLLLSLLETSPDDSWVSAASTLLWNYWITASVDATNETRYAVGRQLLSQLNEQQFGNSITLSISTQTANAAYNLYTSSKDMGAGEDALRIARILYTQQPKISQVLVLNAELEMELGDMQTSLKHWKTISSGSTRGSQQWIQARFNIINILAIDSPQKALAVLEQHQILYPNYGEGPFAIKLQQLHKKLRGSGV